MRYTGNIDLRKSDPLGLDIQAAYLRARNLYHQCDLQGSGDPALPGWYGHNKWYNDSLREARMIHSLLETIAKLVGKDVAEKIKPLRWAMRVNAFGRLKPEFKEQVTGSKIPA